MGQWQKGQSGNPRGRPKRKFHLHELTREHTSDALHALLAIMRDRQATSPQARVAAAIAMLDRGWGRPAQTVYQQTTNVSLDELSDDELIRIARGDAGAGADEPTVPEDSDSVH